VICPLLFRPPVLRFPMRSGENARPLWRFGVSGTFFQRREGEVGRNVRRRSDIYVGVGGEGERGGTRTVV